MNEKAIEKIKPFLRHHPSCNVLQLIPKISTGNMVKCDCGLTKALALLEKQPEPSEECPSYMGNGKCNEAEDVKKLQDAYDALASLAAERDSLRSAIEIEIDDAESHIELADGCERRNLQTLVGRLKSYLTTPRKEQKNDTHTDS